MNRVLINLEVLRENLQTIGNWMDEHGASWTVVTKVLCGHVQTLLALQTLGVRSMGDSRLENLSSIRRIDPGLEFWYLRVPDMTSTAAVVRLADVSLNSEIRVIESLNEEARKQGKIHGVVIMIELGDLHRHSGFPIDFTSTCFDFPTLTSRGSAPTSAVLRVRCLRWTSSCNWFSIVSCWN